MTASGPTSLSMSMTIVLARRNPASLACDLASAEAALYQLVDALRDSRTYRSGKRTDQARHQAKTVARQLRHISRRLYTGPCGAARGHKRLGRYVSVHDRNALDDGGLRNVARELAHVARVLRKIGPWSGASMVVRDSSGESTAARMGDIGQSLSAVLATLVLDLTAADLTGLEPDRLPGVNAIWSSGTVWPVGIADRIRTSSREVAPGVFLVQHLDWA
ncbi:hypothetical protein [Streptomyces sp. GESEQ-4]|uniref:hypothetical protein n=1 Tax=Streptomyces sp. GESEQ-4 TaxID=2812655 RepID=UPI001B33C4C0|nr:hypothetical protein [Streptomyces sp. GESEQ-4]